jgi:hypothetical protein
MDIEKRVTWIGRAQLAGILVGGIIVVWLRLLGIRFVAHVPTFVVMWIPFLVGGAATLATNRAPRREWLVWAVGVLMIVAVFLYLGITASPTELLPTR